MKLKVQLIIESDSGETEVMQEVAELESVKFRGQIAVGAGRTR